MPEGVLDHVDLRIVRSMSDAADFLEWLGRPRDVLGVDTETGGFDFKRDELRLVQFGDLTHGWAIPWGRWSGLVVEILKKYDKPMVFHNSPFDVKFLLENAPELKRWRWEWTHDTMTMTHLLNPLRSKALKTLGATYVDPSAANAQRLLSEAMATNKWGWNTVPIDFPAYWVYGAMDPVITCYLFDKFKKDVLETPVREAYGLEVGVLRVLTDMMRRGVQVDLTYCVQKSQELGDYVKSVIQHIAPTYGVRSVNSSAQLAKAFERLGVEVPRKMTNGGVQSWDKEVIEGIDHDLARYVLSVRKIEKQIGPYFKNFLDMADDQERVHPTIWATAARTSRMSITEPALQTLPRRDPTVRNAFIPSPGNSLISIDADQIEARLAAHFSGDPGMIAAFSGEEDFFVELARQIFDDPGLVKGDKRRDVTKNAIYGKIYGAGPETMARAAGVSPDQMVAVVETFDSKFPGLRVMSRAINDTAMQRRHEEGVAYIVTPYGRRLMSDEDREYALTNYLIQGHAAEILKRCLLELDAGGLGDYLVLPVHDEVVMDAPAEDAPDVLKQAESIMNDFDNYAVPITWSGEVMDRRWGQKYE